MPHPRPGEIWFAEEPERRPRLSRERITDAAVALLDADGVAALSMRRLAARLGAGTMSLYEYVRSKEDVLDLAADAVIAEIDVAGIADLGWREALCAQMTRSREVMRRHPWLPALMATRPLLGPNALARSELVYSLLERAGLEKARLNAAVAALTYYVQGYTAAENTWRSSQRDTAAEVELRRQAQQYLDSRGALHPTLARHADLGNSDYDASFRIGLETILDGIEAHSG
ncbi:transcriptional regulator, TetR family [Streptoalloteichus tenebrarius]|uniref:Transcriptional regulator, TetR family n=1 Tax=Streptoalloteichus tenebrarius (strain ATCC 17920 / DSM 40477 / JCM 4838 / CBS 697.72 / NBRC 16177 / NCIMB 11028 / NRRL B-12390 / A12253. 1 / ISP 5477) TaxID=1933 RepID=A0ABT1I0L2_STRSD|nr:TetR/AcrR family transcriptional regulator [Streptoalloteichus tenebrarius]MCP2261321.1 transcriptional regulator, TetR family [Streptoalloteichus tenebrarius]BFF03721.1 TetR/AcrR family transcriptional regulator [Streptoalloteichus tenebrarius]